MGRFRRITYKSLAAALLVVGSLVVSPTMPLIEVQQEVIIGFIFGIIASIVHDLIGQHIVGVLVRITEGNFINFIAIVVTILTYGGMLVALLFSFGILIVAFVPGLTVVAQEEVRSAGIFVTALTVIVIEVINTEDQLH